MEHQSAVAYGNRFENGYLGRDWTGVGISLAFDFIIIHESGARVVRQQHHRRRRVRHVDPRGLDDLSGMPVRGVPLGQGRRAQVPERLQVEECTTCGPIIAERGVNAEPTEDQYFKGALLLNTLRSVVDDDAKWFALHPRLLSALQVPEHHDRGRRRVLQPAHRHEPDADLQPVPAPRRTFRGWNCCLAKRRAW